MSVQGDAQLAHHPLELEELRRARLRAPAEIEVELPIEHEAAIGGVLAHPKIREYATRPPSTEEPLSVVADAVSRASERAPVIREQLEYPEGRHRIRGERAAANIPSTNHTS